MMLLDLLTPPELTLLRDVLQRVPWVDGKTTAGAQAKRVKRNRQADPQHPLVQRASASIEQALLRSGAFVQNIYPVKLTAPMFSSYSDGMEYGPHIDNALAHGVRVDVAITIFLSEPDSYDGGELNAEGNEPVKLEAGRAVIYPATTLHSVSPVTRGERLAAVIWAQSRIRAANQRQLLMDLGQVFAHLQSEQPEGPATNLALQTYANLARMWLE